VVEVLQDLQGTAHNAVAALTPDMGHKTHAARIMLIRCTVQTLRLQVLNFGGGCHVLLLETQQGAQRIP
jgi:hypothetical protein